MAEGRTRPGHGASAATGRVRAVGAADHERRGRWRNDEGDGQPRQVSDGGGATAGGRCRRSTSRRGVDAEATAGGALRSTAEGRTRPGRGASAATGRIRQVGAADHERRGRWRNDEGDGQPRQVSDGGGATAGGRCRRSNSRRGVDAEATTDGAPWSTAEGRTRPGHGASAATGRIRRVGAADHARRGRWRNDEGDGQRRQVSDGGGDGGGATAGERCRRSNGRRGVDAEATTDGAPRSTAEGRTRPGHGASAATGRIRRVGAADHERRGRWRNDEGDGQPRQVSDDGGDGGGATGGGRCRRSASRRGVDAEATAGAERRRRVNGGTGSSGGPTATGEPWWSDGGGATVAGRWAALRRWRTVGRPRSIATGDGGSPGPRRR